MLLKLEHVQGTARESLRGVECARGKEAWRDAGRLTSVTTSPSPPRREKPLQVCAEEPREVQFSKGHSVLRVGWTQGQVQSGAPQESVAIFHT